MTAALHPQQVINEASLLSLNAERANAFWLQAAQSIEWIKTPTKAYGKASSYKGGSTWFPDGTLNSCFNALDRHVRDGFGDRVCFHHYSPMELSPVREQRLSYADVLDRVKTLSGVLRHTMNVRKGDRVVIYMPMIPETAIAMLACARLGAIHSVVFGGFAPKELAKRIDDAEPTCILAASAGIEPKGLINYHDFVTKALDASKKRCPVLLLRRNIKGHDTSRMIKKPEMLDWEEETVKVQKNGKKVEECVEVESHHPLYILYTSGTTGTPKGVVRFNGGHAVASRYSMQHQFGLERHDTIFCASDFGWVVGHSYILYCPLFLGATSIIFEGKPVVPTAAVFWQIVERYKVNVMFSAPTAFRAIRREDPQAELMKKSTLRSLRALFLAGERSEPGLITQYQRLLDELAAPGALVNDNWWSTEIGSPITAVQMSGSFAPLKARPGAAGLPLAGMDVRIVDDEGKPVKQGTMGNIVLGQPLPPSALQTVWRNDRRFQEAYMDRFRGKGDWYDTGDAGVIDEQGYVSVLSRADDLINVAGHRLGTSLLEQVIASHPHVAECCVVGLPDQLKGHVPFALVTRASSKEASESSEELLLKAINDVVREDVGSIATLGGLTCSRLPKTRSGKTLRRTVKELVENAVEEKWDKQVGVPPTIEDASAVDDARDKIFAYFKKRQGGKAKL